MSRMNALGDRIKGYEAQETERRAMKGLPLVARVDGRSFSTFTAGMRRPYDEDLANLMVDVAKYLVEQVSGARVAQTQSDEISLIMDPFGAPSAAEALRCLEFHLAREEERDFDAAIAELDEDTAEDADRRDWLEKERVCSARSIAMMRQWIDEIRRGLPVPDQAVDFMFSGKMFKLTSIIASLATARFVVDAVRLWPERCAKQLPVFDCRVFPVPSRAEAVAALMWRELDATVNAVSMAARAHFSPGELHGKTAAQMQEMLFQRHGINFNDYPARFRRGVYIRRRSVAVDLPAEVMARIPEQHRPSEPVQRRETVCLDLPPIAKIVNRVEVLLDGAEPVMGA